MVSLYIVCDACNKPKPANDINEIAEDRRTGRLAQFYCSNCFAIVDYDKIMEKHQELVNAKPVKRKGGRSSGLFISGHKGE